MARHRPVPAFAAPERAAPVPAAPRRAPPPSETLARDWMATHQRIIGFWLERLVADGGEPALIDTLHRQATWLGVMLERRGR